MRGGGDWNQLMEPINQSNPIVDRIKAVEEKLEEVIRLLKWNKKRRRSSSKEEKTKPQEKKTHTEKNSF